MWSLRWFAGMGGRGVRVLAQVVCGLLKQVGEVVPGVVGVLPWCPGGFAKALDVGLARLLGSEPGLWLARLVQELVHFVFVAGGLFAAHFAEPDAVDGVSPSTRAPL